MTTCSNSLIFDLCKHRDWRRIELECNREPSNAAYNMGDDIGSLSLHIACKKQPTARVIRSLIKAFPKAVHKYDANGYLPLHLACLTNASTEVLLTLTDSDPETATMFTASGESTIAILSRARDTTETNVNFHDPTLWLSETTEINYGTVYWKKVQVLLEAIAIHRQSRSLQCVDDLFTLHAATSLSWCPADVLYFSCYQYSEQVRMTDDSGCLPLHVAVRRIAYYRSNETIAGKLHLREKSIILPRLLQLYPEAAHHMDPTEPTGRYPLHTALVNKHEWHGGLKELYQQFPEAALTIDPVENLYPFQLASYDLDTSFQLLRGEPSALMNLLSLSKNDDTKAMHQAPIHSPPQSTPHQREKRRKHAEVPVQAERDSLEAPFTFLDSTHSDTNSFIKSRMNRSKGDIYFNANDGDEYENMFKNRDVIWEPTSYERRRQRDCVVTNIPEVIIAVKAFQTCRRRGRNSSVVPSIIVATIEPVLNPEPALVEDSEQSVAVSIDASAKEFFSEDGSTDLFEYMHRDFPSEQSVSTRLVRNLKIERLSVCSETSAVDWTASNHTSYDKCKYTSDDSSSSDHSSYNKYKVQKEHFMHECDQDIISRKVRKLYKQPKVEIIKCSTMQ